MRADSVFGTAPKGLAPGSIRFALGDHRDCIEDVHPAIEPGQIQSLASELHSGTTDEENA
jgi:hypothetical protein